MANTKTKTKPTSPKVVINTSILKDIDSMRIASRFENASMAVDVDHTAGKVSITFAPSYGNVRKTVKLSNPASTKVFAEALVKLTHDAHEAAKTDLSENGTGLLLKAVALNAVRDPIKNRLAASNRNKKVAIAILDEIVAAARAKAEKIEDLEAELANLKG